MGKAIVNRFDFCIKIIKVESEDFLYFIIIVINFIIVVINVLT